MNVRHHIYSISCENVFKTNLFQKNGSSLTLGIKKLTHVILRFLQRVKSSAGVCVSAVNAAIFQT